MKRLRSAALGVVALCVLAGCRVEVYDGLSQRDANEITALLLSANVDARRIEEKSGTFAVEVAEDQFAIAVQLISESGLPRPEFKSMVDVFSNDSLISSPSEERARIGYAVSQELSQTVSGIDGVVSARVHLATPALDPLGRRVTKSSASVAIHHEEALETNGLIPRIKLLVSHAVDDLEYDDVLVALFPVKQMMPSRKREQQGDGGAFAVSDSGSSGSGGEQSFLDELQWPASDQAAAGARQPARVVSRASAPEAGLNPAVAAILAGGLIVLLIAAKSLFDRPRRVPARVDVQQDPRTRSRERNRK